MAWSPWACTKKRPEVTPLVVVVGRGAVRVAEEGPRVVFADGARRGVARVEGQHAELHVGHGLGEVFRRAVDERPEVELRVVVALAAPVAEQRPELEAVVPGPVDEAQERPRGVRGVAASFFRVHIEREEDEMDAIIAEAVFDGAAQREERAVAFRGVGGVAGKIKRPDVKMVKVGARRIVFLVAVDQLEKLNERPSPSRRQVKSG